MSTLKFKKGFITLVKYIICSIPIYGVYSIFIQPIVLNIIYLKYFLHSLAELVHFHHSPRAP